MNEKRFWTAHVRGADFVRLKKLGFRAFTPMMDDYVFLEVTEKNEQFLRKQDELGLKFLRNGRELRTVSEAELVPLGGSTMDRLVPGAEVLVAVGYCEKLEGKVVERNGDKVKCVLRGFKRTYEVELPVQQVVLKGQQVLEPEVPDEGLIS